MHVLIDADIVGYRVGFASEEESETIAIARVANFLEDLLWVDLFADTYQGYLTGKTNFRNEIAVTAPYKGNRTSAKPKHFDIIREYMLNAWDFKLSDGEEADDLISIAHVEHNYESVIASIDKDFLQLKGKHWNFVKREMKEVTEQEALINFYMQVLTGDKVDNIIGLKGIGPVKAAKILNGRESAADMYSACIEAYSGDETRVIENCKLLHLRRTVGEIWQPPTGAK